PVVEAPAVAAPVVEAPAVVAPVVAAPVVEAIKEVAPEVVAKVEAEVAPVVTARVATALQPKARASHPTALPQVIAQEIGEITVTSRADGARPEYVKTAKRADMVSVTSRVSAPTTLPASVE
ncbi:MAG: hypothetical protein P8N90_03750, partial [Glaciecola sp.]|nr:hypothetical protein [Glaciecola sp.]